MSMSFDKLTLKHFEFNSIWPCPLLLLCVCLSSYLFVFAYAYDFAIAFAIPFHLSVGLMGVNVKIVYTQGCYECDMDDTKHIIGGYNVPVSYCVPPIWIKCERSTYTQSQSQLKIEKRIKDTKCTDGMALMNWNFLKYTQLNWKLRDDKTAATVYTDNSVEINLIRCAV